MLTFSLNKKSQLTPEKMEAYVSQVAGYHFKTLNKALDVLGEIIVDRNMDDFSKYTHGKYKSDIEKDTFYIDDVEEFEKRYSKSLSTYEYIKGNLEVETHIKIGVEQFYKVVYSKELQSCLLDFNLYGKQFYCYKKDIVGFLADGNFSTNKKDGERLMIALREISYHMSGYSDEEFLLVFARVVADGKLFKELNV